MLKIVSLFLFVSVSSFIASATNSIKASAEVQVTATPTPQTVVNGSCDPSDISIVTTTSRVKPGGIVTFEIKSDRPLQGQPIWTVSAGQILSGQGTAKVQVLAPNDPSSIQPEPMNFPELGEQGYLIVGGSNPRRPHFNASFVSSDTCFKPVRSQNIFFGNPLENQFANMVDLTLSISEVGISCGNTADGSGPMAVSVESHAFDEEGDVLGYAYSANGGKIIGNGRKIIWDLAGVKPGTYEIKASVDDGCGFCGRSITKKVTVYGTCDNPTESVFSCDCPELMVDGSYDGVRPGDELEFSAELLGKQVAVPVYNWTVKNGKIISGQGTEEITVLTDSKRQTGAVTATVQIPVYDTYCNCPTTTTASVPFAEHSIIIDVNQFAFVENLILDETELTLPPRPGETPLEGTKFSPDMLIDVKTVATDPENDPLTYSYVVSGGRIIGKGAKVMWDLSGVEPGTYKITAGVDDGCGICGRTVTKEVSVHQ